MHSPKERYLNKVENYNAVPDRDLEYGLSRTIDIIFLEQKTTERLHQVEKQLLYASSVKDSCNLAFLSFALISGVF